MTRAFGFGTKTGVDLPEDVNGRVGGRSFKQSFWEQNHEAWCKRAETGYPEVAETDPDRASLLKEFAKENCTEGMRFRAGDAVNLSIGQGDTVVSPLQMAVAYAAIANGGTIYEPRLAKAIMNSDGTVAKRIDPQAKGTLPIEPEVRDYIHRSLIGVTNNGTGAAPFVGFPLSQIPIASKTGTGQVTGRDSNSWFVSYAPANDPKYVIVMMVSQGGTGSGTSAPSVRKIYEAIFGVVGNQVFPERSIFSSGSPSESLPTIGRDGLPIYPEMNQPELMQDLNFSFNLEEPPSEDENE
jgi:penicillin-binding protein 2